MAFNRHNGAQPLPVLRPGDPVLVKLDGEKGWRTPAEVVQKCAPWSYIIDTPRGRVRCNRRHLRPRPVAEVGGGDDQLPEQQSATLADPGGTQTTGAATPPDEAQEIPAEPRGEPPPEPVSTPEGSPPVRVTRCGRHVIKPARFRDD